MKTQQDHRVRIVALCNLEEICRRASGVCHVYSVTKVSRSRVHVEYSRPDEYGNDDPCSVVFPCYPSSWPGDEDNPRVILDIMRTIGSRDGDDVAQYFDPIISGVSVWRNGPDGAAWETHAEIRDRLTAAGTPVDPFRPDTCTVCDIPAVDRAREQHAGILAGTTCAECRTSNVYPAETPFDDCPACSHCGHKRLSLVTRARLFGKGGRS